jgi:hypothetical protein
MRRSAHLVLGGPLLSHDQFCVSWQVSFSHGLTENAAS